MADNVNTFNLEARMKPPICLLGLSLFLALAMPWSASAWPGSIQGRVINHETTTGIEGVFVYASWIHSGSDGLGSRTSCAKASVVMTDANGAYSLPSGPWLLESDIQVYKPGLEEILDPAADVPWAPQIHRMVPLSSPSRRERDFVSIRALLICKIPNTTEVLTPLYQAADEEAAKLGIKGNFMKSLSYIGKTERETKKGAR